jgi:hypothetical protein
LVTCARRSAGKFFETATPSFGIGPAASITLVFAMMSAGMPALVRTSLKVAAPSTCPLYTASAALS